jgi:hypothetical protein
MDIDTIAAHYESSLREWADLTRRPTKGNVRAANQRVDDGQVLQKQLRETAEGRAAIEQLARDPDRLVRGWAATHCLQWNPAFGRAILEELRDGAGMDGPGWDMAGFNAKWTLKTLDAGTLDLDWEPNHSSSLAGPSD